MFRDRDFLEDSESSGSFEGGEDQPNQFESGSKFEPADLDQDFESPEYPAQPYYAQQFVQAYSQPSVQPPAPQYSRQPEQYAQPRPYAEPYSQPYNQPYSEPHTYAEPFTQPRVQTPPRTAYDEQPATRPLKKAENEKVGFLRFDEPEQKPTTASARPGSSSAAMRAKMLEKQRNQYSSKKESFQVTSSGTTSMMSRAMAAEGPVDMQPAGKEYRSHAQPFASHIYEPSGLKPESSLAPVKAERTVFGIEEIEEVQLDESKATKHAASKTVQSFQKPAEVQMEPPLTPRQEIKQEAIVEEVPPPVQRRTQAESKPPAELQHIEPPKPREAPPEETKKPPIVEEETKRPPPQEEVKQRQEEPKPVPRRPVINVQQVLAEAMQDMHSFLTRPLPRDITLQCTIRRERGGFNRLYPKYFLFTSDTRAFLLAGKKRPGNKTSNYLMSMSEKELKTKSPAYLGKVRSNFMGTEFTVYDKGLNPKKKQATLETYREELSVVMYQSNLLGAKGPRKMRVLLPAVNAEGERYRWKPANVSCNAERNEHAE